MKHINTLFEECFTTKLSEIGWKIFNHQYNKIVASKKTILINTDRQEVSIKQDLRNMLSFVNGIAFDSYFEFVDNMFVLRQGMEEMFSYVAKCSRYYTDNATLFVVDNTGKVFEASHSNGEFSAVFDYEKSRYNLMESGCMNYQRIGIASLPSGARPHIDLHGIVTLPRDYNDDDSMVLSEVIIGNGKEVTVLYHQINLDVDDGDSNKVFANKRCMLFSFYLRGGAIYSQIYDVPQPSWYKYIETAGDLIKTPFNKDIWEIFDKREMAYEPRYDSERIFVDYEKNTYVNGSGGWKRFVQEDIHSLDKETYEEYQMYMNVVSISY